MNPSEPLILEDGSDQVRVIWLTDQVARVTHSSAGQPFPPDRPWYRDVLLDQPALSMTPTCEAQIVSGCVQFLHAGKRCWGEAAAFREDKKGQYRLSISIQPDEVFFGLGEWFNTFARRSGKAHLQARESPALLQGRQTYSTIPVLFSNKGYAFFLLNSHASDWVIQPQLGRLDITTSQNSADYIVIFGKTPKDQLQTYTTLTGRPPLLPRWAFGLWVTSYPQEHQQRVEDIATEHRQRSIPLDALILDYHWEDKFHNFKWRRKLFPDPTSMIQNLTANGIRTGLIFTPFVNHRNDFLKRFALATLVGDVPGSTLLDDERALPEYQEARSKGYLAHENTSWWFGSGGMLDFTNPAAAGWWNGKLKPLYDQGVAFFKNDDGEYLPEDARSCNGMDGSEYHNLYGFYYGKALFDGMTGLDDRRAMIYARSVWAGSQRYPGIFLGDQKPDETNLRRAMRAGLNMSMLGFAYWTADTFGLDGKTTPDAHLRYAQWALFSPIARYFLRPPAVDATRTPWAHGLEVEESFRTHVELRYRLLPYFCQLAWQAWQRGLPILRPLYLEFPDSPALLDVDDEMMLGDQLLLAAVTSPGAVEREVHLPPGGWFSYWSGESYKGGQTVTISAPRQRLPLFVRAGSLLPMGLVLQHIPDDHHFNHLEINAWPPFNNKLDFTDDDGRTRAYQRGEFSVTHMSIQTSVDTIHFTVEPTIGGYAGQPPVRELTLAMHALQAAPKTVLIDQQPAVDWQFDPTTHILSIPFSCPLSQTTEVVIQ